jgi:hypothetical protein
MLQIAASFMGNNTNLFWSSSNRGSTTVGLTAVAVAVAVAAVAAADSLTIMDIMNKRMTMTRVDNYNQYVITV